MVGVDGDETEVDDESWGETGVDWGVRLRGLGVGLAWGRVLRGAAEVSTLWAWQGDARNSTRKGGHELSPKRAL